MRVFFANFLSNLDFYSGFLKKNYVFKIENDSQAKFVHKIVLDN
jgi:hypothetical protein